VIEERWREAALSPPLAHGPPPARGRVRVVPEDFRVEEQLSFTADGAGAHVLLRVQKRNANTDWVARQLAAIAGCRAPEVGYAGLKDRRAVTVQWFSVPAGRRAPEEWNGLAQGEFTVLEAIAHGRKLPRGALAGNGFSIRVRELAGEASAVGARLEAIARRGVPNYFGAQRFGRGGGNLERLAALERAHSVPRGFERGIVLSSARSVLFNAVAAERVAGGSWERLEAGDLANLDGRGSVFPVGALSPDLEARCARLEIHPTGPMWGRGALGSGGAPREREQRIAAQLPRLCALLESAGLRQERRSLRLAVHELEWSLETDLTLSFRLTRGGYATAVLRELLSASDEEEPEGEGE